MKDLIIIGAGDNGREISWLVERINQVSPCWNLLGYVDDNPAVQGTVVDGDPVLGTTGWLCGQEREVYVVCSIATGRIRKKVMDRVLERKNLRPATLIDPSAIVGRNVAVGEGSVICAGSILTISITLGAHTIINTGCTVGHDTVLEPCCTVHPGANIAGKVRIGSCTDVGSGSRIIQGLTVCPGCVLGSGSVVVRDITQPGTYAGVPVRLLHT